MAKTNINIWLKYAKKNGIKITWVGPIHSFSGLFGIEVPPTIFWSFRTCIVVGLIVALAITGLILGTFMLSSRSYLAASTTYFVSVFFIGGFGLGLCLARLTSQERAKLGLNTWAEFIEKHRLYE